MRLFNIPSYLHAAEVPVSVPGFGELVVDVAYGGNYYAIVEPQKTWAGLDAMSADEILKWSPAVRRAVQEAVKPVHPLGRAYRGSEPCHVGRQAETSGRARPERRLLR